jgi:hypothetical protein
MHEALELFEEICNNHYFRDSAMVLFLNKKDLFADKINKVDLRVCFPGYEGTNITLLLSISHANPPQGDKSLMQQQRT